MTTPKKPKHQDEPIGEPEIGEGDESGGGIAQLGVSCVERDRLVAKHPPRSVCR
jgi:hypothetical protein